MSDASATSNILQMVRGYFAKARGWVTALSRPARILILSTTLVTVGLVGWLAFRAAHEPYAPLFTQLDREDASAITLKLKELKIPYKLADAGTSIEVPEARVYEIRVELASSGLPRGGGVGFESFDKMKLGATEFEQRVLYRRALEGELARTMGSIASIQAARVHLVLPERSVFVSKDEAASASVILTLRPGRTVGGSEVQAIVNLCASAVPGLTADRISVVSTGGVVLHRPHLGPGGAEGGSGSVDGSEPTQSATIERSLEDRTRAMLERVVGVGHVEVRVAADVDLSRIEHVEDHFDPKTTALRSEEMSIDKAAADDSVAGVPGAESNLPETADSTTPAAAGAGVIHEAHTRNFEIDHITEKRVTTTGVLKHLTVAVAIEGGASPRSPEEITKITALVRSAVGADDKRGDLVTVEELLFAPQAVAEMAPITPSPMSVSNLLTKFNGLSKRAQYITMGVAAFFVLLMALGVRRVFKSSPKKALEATFEPPVLPAARDFPVLTAETNPRNFREEAHTRALQDPATAALVLQHWLGGVTEPATAKV